MTIFNSYTKRRCEYDCGLKVATEEINCVPWNYIHVKEGLPFCTRDMVAQFEAELTKAQNSDACRQ